MNHFPRITPFSLIKSLALGILLALLAIDSSTFVLGTDQSAEGDSDRTTLAVEALMRLENTNLETNPALKTPVEKILAATRGTPDFVRLVKKFRIEGQDAALLEAASRHPKDETATDAVRLVLGGKNPGVIKETLLGTNIVAAGTLADLLGNGGGSAATEFLALLVTDASRDAEVRKQAVRAMARSEDGAAAVLELARAGRLPDDLKFTAGSALAGVRWPKIKAEAASLLPLPQGQNAQPLPPLSELLAMKGDADRGAKLFFSEETKCTTCHRVRGQGNEVGPDLSGVGIKLGKDALFEAILDPSSGISFGFEAWELNLKSGEDPLGLIVSDAADEVVLKMPGGITTRYPKSEITGRRRMTLSLMPSGLQQTMSTQGLVDLVEFLATLKN